MKPNTIQLRGFSQLIGKSKLKTKALNMALMLLLLLTFKSEANAQTNSSWNSLVDTLQIKISYSISSCNGKDRILLKVENNSLDSVLLTWDDNLLSGSQSFSSSGSSINKSIHIGSGNVIEGTCEQILTTERMLCIPIDLFLQGNYTLAALSYTITGLTKSTL